MARVRAVNEQTARRLMSQNKAALERASKQFEMFHQKEPKKDIILDIPWPEDQVELGVASAEGYRSNKWNEDHEFEDYIHRHRDPLPVLLIQRPEGADLRDDILREASEQDTSEFAVERPKNMVFTWMGYCLDIEYIRDGVIQKIDYSEGELPNIACHPDLENVLVVIPSEGTCVLITSPILVVTEHGIEN